jgi:hypothetical protein
LPVSSLYPSENLTILRILRIADCHKLNTI